MIKIAFCDDDLSVLKELSILMDRYRVERNQDITYAAFHSPLELLAEELAASPLSITKCGGESRYLESNLFSGKAGE